MELKYLSLICYVGTILFAHSILAMVAVAHQNLAELSVPGRSDFDKRDSEILENRQVIAKNMPIIEKLEAEMAELRARINQ